VYVDRARFLLLTSAIAAACSRAQAPSRAPGTARPDEGTTGPGEDALGQLLPPPDETAPDVEPAAPSAGEASATCADLRVPGPSCEQGMDVGVAACAALAEVALPGIAEPLMECLVARSQSGGPCGPSDWYGDCGKRALERVSALEEGRRRDCQTVAQQCRQLRQLGLAAEDCLRMVSAVHADLRDDAITCMTEGCGADHCFLELAWQKAL
jgi:hypothetical protein